MVESRPAPGVGAVTTGTLSRIVIGRGIIVVARGTVCLAGMVKACIRPVGGVVATGTLPGVVIGGGVVAMTGRTVR